MSKYQTNIYLLRHGHIELPAQKSYIGQWDLPLSLLGQAQMRAWQAFFASKNIASIICSDLIRCTESAKLLSNEHTPIIIEPSFREINLGSWDGHSIAIIKEKFPEDYAMRGKNMHSFRPPHGESFEDLSTRIMPTLNKYIAEFSGKNIIILAHAGVNKVILANYLALPLKYVMNIPQPYACCSHLYY